jgi:hypothetical protein
MKIIYLFLTIFLYVYFPEKFKLVTNLLQKSGIKIAYNIIYFYGVCQIKCNQLYNFTLPFFKKYNVFSFISYSLETTNPKIELEVFNAITNKIVFEKELDKIKLDKIKNSVIILISDTSHINKKILYNFNLESWNNPFELSDISFIALYLNYNDVQYHIILKTDKYNYYLVGNIINKLFLQYYINTVLNNKNFTIDDKKSYRLELMDHEVNMIYLDIEDFIIIEKNGYCINNKKEPKIIDLIEKNDIKN